MVPSNLGDVGRDFSSLLQLDSANFGKSGTTAQRSVLVHWNVLF